MDTTLTIWQGIRLEVPSTWEILQYSRNSESGYLAWADRYTYRLELNWKSVPARPDFDHMLNDYQAKLEADREDDEAIVGLTRRRVHGWHGLVDPNPGGTVRYGTYLPEQERLLELLFIWPERQDRALEDRVLASVRAEAEDGDGCLRWRAFGLDATVPVGLVLDPCSVQPANAAWTFADGDAATQSWRMERLGMVSQWLTDSLREWLDGKQPTDLIEPQYGEQTTAGHRVYWTSGHMPALRFPKIAKRANRYEAAAWICPEDGRLYHASRITTAKVRQPKTLIGSTLRCCAACPKINPARSQEVAS